MLAGSAAAALASGGNEAAAETPPADKATPGIFRYKIGAYELTALYDGIWYRPITDKFIKAPFADVERALDQAFMPHDKLATPFTTLIVNTGKKLVLIDTGTGGQISPSAGVLRDNLAAAGIDSKAVDQIVISHFHPDHINGIKDKDNALIFPNAEIMVPEPEWAYWMSDANMNAAEPDLKLTFRNQRRIFSDIAGQVTRFEPGKEVAPGVETLGGRGPYARAYRVCHSLRQGLAAGSRRHRTTSGRVCAPSRLAGRVRYRRLGSGCDAQADLRSRRGRSHAGDRLSLPLPGLRPSDQDRDRLRARAGRVADKSLA